MDGSRFRAGLLLTLTFAAGAAVGVAGDRLQVIPGVARASEPAEESTRPEGERRGARQTTIERFADDLGLTDQQRAEIETILDEYRSSTKSLREAVQPRYMSLIDSIRGQIESVLTGEQVEQYRDLLEQARDRSRERRGADPGEPGADREGEDG